MKRLETLGAERGRPITPTATGLFFAVATVTTAAAGVSLLAPKGPLDLMWRIKAREHAALLGMGPVVGFGFCSLSVVMVGQR